MALKVRQIHDIFKPKIIAPKNHIPTINLNDLQMKLKPKYPKYERNTICNEIKELKISSIIYS